MFCPFLVVVVYYKKETSFVENRLQEASQETSEEKHGIREILPVA